MMDSCYVNRQKGIEMNACCSVDRICIIWSVLFSFILVGCKSVDSKDEGHVYDLVSPSEVKAMREKVNTLESLSNELAHEFAEEKDGSALKRLSSVRTDIDEILRLLGKVNATLENNSQEAGDRLTADYLKAERESLARMRDYRFQYVRFDPPQNLYDAISFMSDHVNADPAGKGLDFRFRILLAGDQEIYVLPDGSIQTFSKKPIRYPVLPILSASDISYYDLLSLICSSINCDMYVGAKSVTISEQDGCENHFIDLSIPAPQNSPDRDWVTWLSKYGVNLQEGAKIVYCKEDDRLHFHINGDDREEITEAFPLIYSAVEE